MRLSHLRLSALALFALLVCNFESSAQPPVRPEKPKPLFTLYGSHSTKSTLEFLRITSKHEWWDFQNALEIPRDEGRFHRPTHEMEIDFQRVMVLVVFEGDNLDWFTGMQFLSLEESDQRVTIGMRRSVGQIMITDTPLPKPKLTRPWTLFGLPRSEKELVIERGEQFLINGPIKWHHWKTFPPIPKGKVAADPVSAPASEKPKLDINGSALPHGAVARLGSPRWRGLSSDGEFTYTYDGKAIVCLMSDGSLAWLDAEDGRELRRLREPSPHKFTGFALGAEGETAITANDSHLLGTSSEGMPVVKTWNLKSEKATGLRTAEAYTAKLSIAGGNLAFARSLETLSPRYCEIEVLDPTNGKSIWKPEELPPSVCRGLALQSDGRLIAILRKDDGDQVFSWDTPKSKLLHRFDIPKKKPQDAPLYPMGSYSGYRISPDGRSIAEFGVDQQIRRWDVATGKEQPPIAVEKDVKVETVAYSAYGNQLFAGLSDRTIRWWDVGSGKELGRIVTTQVASRLAVSPDGKRLAARLVEEHTLHCFDLEKKVARPSSDSHRQEIEVLGFESDGKTVITAGRDRVVRRWEMNGTLREKFDDLGASGLRYYGLSDDAKRIVGVTARNDDDAESERVEVWDLNAERKVVKIRPTARMQANIALLDNGVKLITRYTGDFTKDESRTELWDLKTGKLIWQAIGSSPRGGHFNRFVVHPDGKRAWAQVSNRIGHGWQAWELSDGRQLGFMHSRIEYGALTPDGRMLFGPDFNGTFLQVLETCSGNQRLYLGIGEPHGFMHDGIQVVSLPGGRLIAARDNDSRSDVIFWDLATSNQIARLRGDGGEVTQLAVSPDGTLLASAHADCCGLLWDLKPIYAKLKPVPVPKPEDLLSLYESLGDANAKIAYPAVVSLQAAGKDTVALMRPRLKQALVELKEVDRAIQELQVEDFAVRNAAQAKLTAVLEQAEPSLREALSKKELPAAALKRIERILEGTDGFVRTPVSLREVRGVEVLEGIDSVESRALLAELAAGHARHRLTQEASSALKRLARSKPAENR